MAGPWEQYQQAVPPIADSGPWTQYAAPEAAAAPPFNWQDYLKRGVLSQFNPPAPAGGPGGLNSIYGGAVRGLRDPVDAGAQLAAQGLVAASPAGSGMERWAQGQLADVQNVNREAERDYRENWRQGAPPSVDVGRIGGNIALTGALSSLIPGAAAPSLMGRVAAGAGAGGLSGALTPVDPDAKDFWGEKATQTGVGAGVGAALPLVAGGVARLVRPNTSPEVQMLMDAGVRPTPGEILGPRANRLEEAASSIPVAGDFIATGRGRSIEQFNRGAIDSRVLAPIGEKLDPATPVGRAAIAEAHQKITSAYDNITPQLTAKVDPEFASSVNNLIKLSKLMPKDRAEQFQNTVQATLAEKISPNGTLTGESFREAESALGTLARDYRHSASGDERKLGDAFLQLQANMREWLIRSNPDKAEELSAINSAWANYLRVQGASAKTGAEGGVFTPAQLGQAVRELDPTLRKGSFARGEALMQDYADAGKKGLGNKLPDSGTARRGMIGYGLTALASGQFNPRLAAGIGTLGAGSAAAYSAPGQALIANILASRGAGAPGTADAIRELAPIGAAGAYPLGRSIWGALSP